MKKYSILILSILLASIFVLGGCGKEDTANKQAQEKDNTPKQETVVNNTIECTLYFSDDMGEYLIPSTHKIKVENDNKYKAIVEALIKGPDNAKEGISIIPKGTKVLDVKVENNIAYVNLNEDFKKHFPGGSTSELMIIGSIVDTLTKIDDIKAVQILINGKKIDSLSGHLDLSEPQKPMLELIKKN